MFCVQCPQCPIGQIFMGSSALTPASELRPQPCGECGADVGQNSLDRYARTCDAVWQMLNDTNNHLLDVCFKLMAQSRVAPSHILFIKVCSKMFISMCSTHTAV